MKSLPEIHPTTPPSDQEVMMKKNDSSAGTCPTLTEKKPRRFVKALTGLGMAVALGAGSMVVAAPAEAAAFSYGVYAPAKINNTTMEAWANLSRDCSGTVGCFNYIKIEKKVWWGWAHHTGGWANSHGWNSIRATIDGGCGTYRLKVDSYNDIVGSHGSGTNIGSVGTSSNGTKISRFKTEWNGASTHICR